MCSGLTQLCAPRWNLSASDVGYQDLIPLFHTELNKSFLEVSCMMGNQCSSSVPGNFLLALETLIALLQL